MKKVTQSERFGVGWGRKGKRIAFFIYHKELGSVPIPCNPEDLEIKLVELANKIDRKRGKI